MRLHISILLSGIGLLTLALGCKNDNSQLAPLPIAVTVRAVSQDADPLPKVYSGSFEPNREVSAAFQVTGYVDSIKQVVGADGRMRDIQQGDPIKANDLLATVRPDMYQAQVSQLASALTSAEAAEARSERDFKRDSELHDKHVIADVEYDYAEQQYRSAQAQVAQARAALHQADINLGYCKLAAPMGGVILDRSIEIGSLAEPNTVAFRIADTTEMKADFGVSDIEIGRFTAGAPETLMSEAIPDHQITGKVTRIDSEADPSTRVFDVEVTVPNSDGRLRTGMIASLDVEQPPVTAADPPTLPLAAIVRPPGDPQDFAVYVAEDQSGRTIAKIRRVRLGEIIGNEIAVLSGVKTGERVIIRGATMVSDGGEVKIIP
jgi:RND family efflux transporter MFP subunit